MHARRYLAVGAVASARRRSLWCLLLGYLLLGYSAAEASPNEASPAGLWWADQGAAQVELVETELGGLEGHIVWLRSPFGLDGCPLRDRNNPETELRTRPILGLRIIRDLVRRTEASREWVGGRVYEPNSGRTYSLKLELAEPNRLVLRGFIGIELIGQTQTWYRVPETESEPRCGGEEASDLNANGLSLERLLVPIPRATGTASLSSGDRSH